jgi:hypothetical protein
VRISSTATPQSLLLMNGDFTIGQAEALAERVAKDAKDSKDRAAMAWRLVYGQSPSEKELAGALSFLRDATEAFRNAPAAPATPPKKGEKAPEPPTPEARALALFCQALLSSNRFLYVD